MSATFVRLFQPRFADLVESGKKLQTIRKRPRRMPEVGDMIICRAWTGTPYRSKQRDLCSAPITLVKDVQIDAADVVLDGEKLSDADLERFAQADGFSSSEDMLDWFSETHELPFEGILISWANLG